MFQMFLVSRLLSTLIFIFRFSGCVRTCCRTHTMSSEVFGHLELFHTCRFSEHVRKHNVSSEVFGSFELRAVLLFITVVWRACVSIFRVLLCLRRWYEGRLSVPFAPLPVGGGRGRSLYITPASSRDLYVFLLLGQTWEGLCFMSELMFFEHFCISKCAYD